VDQLMKEILMKEVALTNWASYTSGTKRSIWLILVNKISIEE